MNALESKDAPVQARQRRSSPNVTTCVRLGLAVLTTGLSLMISVRAGLLRAEGGQDAWLWALFGAVVVLAAHGLPAACWSKGRAPGVIMWGACIVFLLYTHANYFLTAQDLAGVRRATQVDISVSTAQPGRSLSAILGEKAQAMTRRAGLSLTTCTLSCTRLKAQDAAMEARIQALNAEAEEARRWQEARDSREVRRQTLQRDPIGRRLAWLPGVTDETVTLVMALVFVLILEGIGGLCWFLVLQDVRVQTATPGTGAPERNEMQITSQERQDKPPAPQISDAHSTAVGLLPRIETGEVAPTVAAIRSALRCSQIKARAVRSALDGLLPQSPQQRSVRGMT